MRNIRYLRRSPARCFLFDLLASSGLGWGAIKLRQRLSGSPQARKALIEVESVERFGDWADNLWEESKPGFALSAVRDCATLNILYPDADNRFIRLRIAIAGKMIGWVVLLVTRMCENKFFGNMTVATVADGLALSGYEREVVAAATGYVANKNVDMIVTNQSHENWRFAFEASGFLHGPSNFIFAASPKLAARLEPFENTLGRIHLNRGDGDGPIHL